MPTLKELKAKAKKAGVKGYSKMTKAEIKAVLAEPVKKEAEAVEDAPVEAESKLTFLGEGPLSGEYRFAEISGSVSARNKEEAIQKAEELLVKHPRLVNK